MGWGAVVLVDSGLRVRLGSVFESCRQSGKVGSNRLVLANSKKQKGWVLDLLVLKILQENVTNGRPEVFLFLAWWVHHEILCGLQLDTCCTCRNNREMYEYSTVCTLSGSMPSSPIIQATRSSQWLSCVATTRNSEFYEYAITIGSWQDVFQTLGGQNKSSRMLPVQQ